MITLATDDASVGMDLDLQDLAVLGAGKHTQLQTTLRTLRRIELDTLAALGQSGLHRPTMSCAAGPLPQGARVTPGWAARSLTHLPRSLLRPNIRCWRSRIFAFATSNSAINTASRLALSALS